MTHANGTRAVDRAAELLALVVRADQPPSFSGLVERTGLAKSTTSRLLSALGQHDLVLRDDAGTYRPGRLFALHAARHDWAGQLSELAWPLLERLSAETGETVNLAVLHGDVVAQVAQVDSTYLLGTTNWVGVDVPAHCSSTGKVFLAFGRQRLRSGPLERRTPFTITSRAALAGELDRVTARGYAVAREELELGLVAVAAPVWSAGQVIAGISVSGPTARIDHARAEQIGALLVREANELSALLGHSPRKPGEEGAA